MNQVQYEGASMGISPKNASRLQEYASPAPQTIQTGIMTATQDLAKEVSAIAELAFNLRAALGITVPETDNCKNVGEQSLLNLLQSLTYRLRSANGDLSDVLRHLTS